MLHRVKNVSPEQKLTVESLPGHTVSEDESVSIKSIGPSASSVRKPWRSFAGISDDWMPSGRQ